MPLESRTCPIDCQRRRFLWPFAKFGLLALSACGKPEPTAESPRNDVAATHASSAALPATEASTNASGSAETATARVEIAIELHRTRVGSGRGFWVLGMISNPHEQPIIDPRVHVQLLDGEGERVGETEALVDRILAPKSRAAVAVLVAEPVEHEQLELRASGIMADASVLTELPLKLEHEPPQRAELGGYFVLGQVTNTGSQKLEAARLEICGLDRSGRLLGVDDVVLDSIEAGEAIQFDVGDLRYEEAPASFTIELLRPLR